MIDNFNELIANANSIAIAGHVRPDGDCVGSCLAIYNYIISNFENKDVHVILQTIPSVFKFLKNSDKIEAEEDFDENVIFDLFICLDCGDGDRLGRSAKLFSNSKVTVCIDHHASNSSFAMYNYIIPDESSTCEMVYNQIGDAAVDKAIAECIYTGIIHDTGVFQYSCCTERTMQVAGRLMSKGIDYPTICNASYYEKTLVQNRLLGVALLNAKTYSNDRIIAAVITKEDLARYNANSRHLEGIVQQLRSTKGVEVAIFLYELEENNYKGSTRATGDVNLVEICQLYGGGGHMKAAGFNVTTSDPWAEIDNIVKVVEKQFDELGMN